MMLTQCFFIDQVGRLRQQVGTAFYESCLFILTRAKGAQFSARNDYLADAYWHGLDELA